MTSNPSASVSPDLRSAAGDAVQRSKAYLLALPIGTLSVFVAVSLIFFIPLATLQLDSFNLALSLNPNSIIFSFQLWRLYTAHWINGNASQYILNVVAALPLFSLIEQRLGTMRFWSLLFSSSILIGTLYTLIALCLEAVSLGILSPNIIPGICGIFFFLLTIECNERSSNLTRSVFGFFNVAAPVFPWVLAVISFLFGWTITLPVAGIISGYSYPVIGHAIILPNGIIAWLENSDWFRPILSLSLYISNPGVVSLPSFTTNNNNGGSGERQSLLGN